MIRLQTAKRADIPNGQDWEVPAHERNWAADLRLRHPDAIIRTEVSPTYNCHGLTFASRRTKITVSQYLQFILSDDSYREVDRLAAMAGDIVMYYAADGDPSHSGIVTANEAPLFVPLICSKWGNGPEVVHRYHDVPPVYGTIHRFYRCHL